MMYIFSHALREKEPCIANEFSWMCVYLDYCWFHLNPLDALKSRKNIDKLSDLYNFKSEKTLYACTRREDHVKILSKRLEWLPTPILYVARCFGHFRYRNRQETI
jgi:hypothetical protein